MTIPTLRGKTVLVVEDEQFTRTMVAQMVRTFEPESVATAPNGARALQVIEAEFRQGVDLIVSDFRMPEMNGIELLQTVRSGEARIPWDTPFAMLTGFADTALVGLAIALDVSAFLAKPLSRAALEARIERLFQKQSGLKDPSHYALIDISAVVEPPEPEGKEEEDRKAPAVVLKADLARPRAAPAPARARPAAKPAPKPVPKAATKKWSGPEKKVSILELKTDQILSRDLNSGDGQMLLAGGTKMSKRLLLRLGELRELDSSLKWAWVRA